jgi:hypothetical protein
VGIEIRQTATFNTDGARTTSPRAVTLAQDVLPGSLLVVAGVSLLYGSYTYSTLTGVTDDRSNTWATPVNHYSSWAAGVWMCEAHAAAAGSTTVSLSFTNTSDLSLSIAVMEVTGAAQANARETYVTGKATTTGSSVTTATTSPLSQPDCLLIGVGGGAFGVPAGTDDWDSKLAVNNGGSRIGTQILARVVSSTDAVSMTVNHESTANARHSLMAVYKAALAGGRLSMMGCGN